MTQGIARATDWRLESWHPTSKSLLMVLHPLTPWERSLRASSCTRRIDICRRSSCIPVVPQFASGDWFRGSDEEIKEEALGYIAYSGPFHTDD
jgi:hypothetical protein